MSLSRFLPAVLVVGGLSACSSGNHVTAPVVASVTVTPASHVLSALGETVRFTAKAMDADGNTLTGQSVSWGSSSPAVATIDSSGLATAVAEGTTTVTATIAGLTGSAVLTVSIPGQACTHPSTVTLAVGEYAAYPSTDCLILPSGSDGDRYRVTVVHPVGTGDEEEPTADTITVALHVTGLGVSASPVVQTVAPALQAYLTPGASQTLLHSLQVERATERLHARMRLKDAALLARLPRSALLPSRHPSTLLRAAARSDLPATLQFDPATPSDCTTGAGKLVTANLLYQNDDMAVYQDSSQHVTKPVSQDNAKLVADFYSSYAKEMIRSYFGANPDIDDNGKLIVFVSPVVDGNTAAFVWTGDLYSKSSCEASNARDMIYFSADLIRSMDDANPSWQALATVAHEAKHVVSLYNRIASGSFHPTWMEEGTAEISGELASRIAWAANGGPAVGHRVTISDLENGNGGITVNQYDYGVLLRLARSIYYLSSQPNGLVVAPTGAGDGMSVYGSGWHFFRWLGDGYGDASTAEADASFFRQQTDSLTPSGTAGLETVTGQPFATLVNQFVDAVSLTGSTAPEPAHPFTTYDFVSATQILQDQPAGRYPWPVTTNGNVLIRSFDTATYAGPIGAWGIRIHDFVSNGTGTGAQLQVSMSSLGTVVVVRLN